MSLDEQQLELFVSALARAPDRWRRLVRHADEHRVYEQIWNDEHVNAWVICWSEDQDTGFHDHDDSAAAITVIEGQVREERLVLGADPEVRLIAAGRTFSVPPSAIHRVLHSGDRPAVTIHAYSPPLKRTGSYRIGAGDRLERVAQSSDEPLRAEPALR